MFDWGDIIDSVLSYIADIGSSVGGWFGDAGSWLGDLFSGSGGAGELASSYGPEAASYMGDVGGGDYITNAVNVGSDYGGAGYTGLGSIDYGGGMADVPALGDQPWQAAAYDVPYGSTVPDYYINPSAVAGDVGGDVYTPDMAYGAMSGSTGNTMEDWQIVNPNNVSTSDILRSRVMETNPAGSEPFHGLTADPLSSIPSSGGNIPDWLKAAAQMAGNFAKGAFGGAGGGAGGGMDPNLLAALGRGGGVPGVGPAGTPQYLGVGGIPQGGEGQMAPGGALGNVPGAGNFGGGGAGGGGNQQYGSPGMAQGLPTPQIGTAASPYGQPQTYGAPGSPNLPPGTPGSPMMPGHPFTPMMIPLPQAPLYPGVQQQPMSGLQRLMMAG